MNKVARFMEHFWLAVAIGTGIVAIWMVATEGFKNGSQWLFFPAVALGMFMFRRFTRRKLEAMEDRRRGPGQGA
jgi:ABC-type polysaccharide/polyol phosphate export permease